jgi:hypothetical protein
VPSDAVAADDDRDQRGDDDHEPPRHDAADVHELKALAHAPTGGADERPEADEHAGDSGQRNQQFGVLHVPSPRAGRQRLGAVPAAVA